MTDPASTIELTAPEKEMLASLSFDPLSFKGNHEGFLRNADLAHQLTISLIERKGIPEHRVRYFTDPEYYPGGRGKSRQDSFVKHGNDHDETLRHPHFLKYLRYFIHGAHLPVAIIRQYTDAVEDCGMVSSSDIPELGAKARNLARMHGLEGSVAADEFFKLSLDLRLSAGQSARIRESVKQLRSSR
ncbi:hypothetical protein [Sphingobium aromaticivastans]|uniref:hypothetical protein n=1 Tax=Sphingobium aromaticivastans TaxID=1778665 RepID=UPI003019D1B7